MNLRFFNIKEFDSPDQPGSGKFMNEEFLKLLDEARDNAEIPFTITSGYRTKLYNDKVGGVEGSSHIKGLAADIRAVGSREKFIIVNSLLLVGFTRIGISKNFIHVDLDKDKIQDVIWTY